jgi:enterobactin synthetase component D
MSIALGPRAYGTTLATLDLQEGRLVAIALGDEVDDHPPAETIEGFTPEERALVATFAPRRRRTWVGGRIALRAALDSAPSSPLLADDRGAPSLPQGVVGSIAHKEPIAVALASRAAGHRVGVDVELATRLPSLRLTSKILAAAEADDLLRGGDDDRARSLLLAFSAKEAIYKAIDPFLRRYVGFHEVRLRGDASAYDVEPLLKTSERLSIAARAWVAGDVVLAVASASLSRDR